MHYVPYRFQGGANTTAIYNNYTIVQPDDSVATIPSGAINRQALFGFGNTRIHQGYEHVTRNIRDYTNLGLSKQNEIILKTNGSAASRQKYVKPATLALYGTAYAFSTAFIGEIVYQVEYVFSGMKRPDVALPFPIQGEIQKEKEP